MMGLPQSVHFERSRAIVVGVLGEVVIASGGGRWRQWIEVVDEVVVDRGGGGRGGWEVYVYMVVVASSSSSSS